MGLNNNDGRKSTKHHIIPKSRGGKSNGNTVRIPRKFHSDWHAVFGNLTPDEAIELIEIIFKYKGRKKIKKQWSHEEIYEKQLKIQQRTIQEEKRKKRKELEKAR
ncbi:MAG: hypothetical protein ABIE43_02480 [Patescibacteria group bacterium]